MRTRNVVVLTCGIAVLGAAGWAGKQAREGLAVHEWGTFTSLQGSDGVPVKWNPLESSQLPRFVYNWGRPGFGRAPTGMLALGSKQALVTLQRMETPVVYFYAPKETEVNLTVRFPSGGITEWYPQASDVGPSVYPQSPFVKALDAGMHRSGVDPKFTLDSVLERRTQKESLITWEGLKILPAAAHPDLANRLPAGASGSHYFAARETDSAFIQLPRAIDTNSQAECEKFLFYRGVANFTAPLHVEMRQEGTVVVSNTGSEPIAHLFVLEIKGDCGDFVSLDGLSPGQQKSVELGLEKHNRTLADWRTQIQTAMAQSLVAQGLYLREAVAMVKTWENSWFAEPGVRVLYLLPRPWTDRTLPMSIEPQPKQLVRVMVGRAELISPGTEEQFSREFVEAKRDQAAAMRELKSTVAGLGRFAEPAFARALARADLQPADQDRLRGLFYAARNEAQR